MSCEVNMPRAAEKQGVAGYRQEDSVDPESIDGDVLCRTCVRG